MWKDLTKRAGTVAVAAVLSFGVAACAADQVNVEDDPAEDAPLGGSEDPIKETPDPSE